MFGIIDVPTSYVDLHLKHHKTTNVTILAKLNFTIIKYYKHSRA